MSVAEDEHPRGFGACMLLAEALANEADVRLLGCMVGQSIREHGEAEGWWIGLDSWIRAVDMLGPRVSTHRSAILLAEAVSVPALPAD